MTWLVRSAIAILYPRIEGLPGAEDCDLSAFLEQFRRETIGLMWLGILAGAVVFHLTPVFTVLVPLPAFLLPPHLADRHAQRIAESRVYLVRQAIMLLKVPGGMAWGADPGVRAHLALPPLPPDPDTWRLS
jgi:hypothetical protein